MDSNLNIDIKDYNGPLDVLLELVHKNKFDLKNLPILSLCNQYIAFIVDLKKVSIEIASEYLLMAAIMVFLKSKYLVNKDKEEDVKKVTRFLTNRLTILELVNKNWKSVQKIYYGEGDVYFIKPVPLIYYIFFAWVKTPNLIPLLIMGVGGAYYFYDVFTSASLLMAGNWRKLMLIRSRCRIMPGGRSV